MEKDFMDIENNITKLNEVYTVFNIVAEDKDDIDCFLSGVHSGKYTPELAVEYFEQKLKRMDKLLDLSIGVMFDQIKDIENIFASEVKKRREISK
ncbi:hypothetical protein DY123_07515 [Apilactobacillus micheneri]|uniref:hypothetical protein n=1 Tax=Apilactobacillus micheneri TaxID=1899430 RepID=UPI00112729CD|nr:hypothetical protein [Apilactobacillus micheneri]TPR41211.1 hypothetical protein DY123_07515 [Apilactobacillus micheneri]